MEFKTFRGMMPIMPTTITADGEIDRDSTDRVVDYLLNAGAVAIGHLGGASEHAKVCDEDREILISQVVRKVNGRVPTFFGAAANNLKDTIRRAKTVEALGGDMIMLCTPPIGHSGSDDIMKYYEKVAGAVNIPIILQDTGGSYGALTVDVIAKLIHEVENIGYTKLEGTPDWWTKMRTMREKYPDVTIIGGAAGKHMLQMLRMGVKAYMTGTEATEIHAAVVNAWLSGDEDLAIDLYYTTLLPYLDIYTTNNRAFLKYMLNRRGIVADPRQLFPADGAPLDPYMAEELNWILDRIDNNKIKCERH